MITTYVLDTSTIIYDPNCLDKFCNSNVVLPIYVLNELDKLKKSPSYVGRNARTFIRLLDELCKKGAISSGVQIEKTGLNLKVDVHTDDISRYGDLSLIHI